MMVCSDYKKKQIYIYIYKKNKSNVRNELI